MRSSSLWSRLFPGHSRRPSKRQDRQLKRRLFLESLESRHLLTAVSIQVLDSLAVEPTSTNIPIGQINKGSFQVTVTDPPPYNFFVSMSNYYYDNTGTTANYYEPNSDYYIPEMDSYYGYGLGAWFGPSITSRVFTVIPRADVAREPTETVAWIAGGTGTYPYSYDNTPISIDLQDTSPTVSVSATGNANETGNTSNTFVLTRSYVSDLPMYVAVDLSGTAMNGIDYAQIDDSQGDDPPSPEWVIPANSTSMTITVTPSNDTGCEGDETVIATLLDAGGYAIGTASATMKIKDGGATAGTYDFPPVSVGNWSGQENQGPATFNVTLAGTCPVPIGVSYATVADTANDTGTYKDYNATSGGLTFASGETSKTVTVGLIDDDIDEDDEAFGLSATVTFLGGNTATGTATILDNDPPPTISINDVTVNENAGQATFTATLSKVSGKTITASYSASGTGTYPTSSNDLSSTTGTLTFPPETTTQTFSIGIVNDNHLEYNETFLVGLSSLVNVTAGDTEGLGTINDNDPATISINDVTAWEYDSAATLTASLSVITDIPVTVDYATADGTAHAPGDYTSKTGTLSFSPGGSTATLSVSLVNDTVLEPDETLFVNLSSPTNASIGDGQGKITIKDNERESPQRKKCSCSQDVDSEATDDAKFSVGDEEYSGRENPHPIVPVDVTFDAGAEQATSIEAKLTFGGIVGSSVYYNPSAITSNTSYHFALMADASSLASGSYDWTISLTEHYSGQPDKVRSFQGRMEIANRINGEFGNRWSNTLVDRLTVQTGGVALIQGDGNISWFAETSPGQFVRENGEVGYSTLSSANSQYVLTDKNGAKSVFGSTGLLTKKIDRIGNETNYTYIDADNDGLADEVKTIVDPAGRTTTYGYTGQRVTTITDFAGRVTSLAYDGSGHMTGVTYPDPDGNGPLTAATETFGYDATGLITSHTDTRGKTTALEYNADRTLKKLTNPDNTHRTFAPSLNAGVVDTSGGVGTQSNLAPLVPTDSIDGYQSDESGNTRFFTTDRFGEVTKETDALGNVTLYQRDGEGRVTQMTEPDPDGNGPLPAPVTQYTYDSNGNTTQITYPDSSVESWTYNITFGEPTSHTDRLGHRTIYTLDGNTGLVTAMEQVVGQTDGQGNSETDDLFTYYTYTGVPANQNDPPAGLLVTTTDPLGQVTRNSYNSRGDVVGVTYAQGTADEASVSYEYNAADNMTASIDELGRRTEFVYDSRNQLITKTLPDPDGNGSLASPVYHYVYDGSGLLTQQTDPLNRVTTYVYDDLGRLTSTNRPDHDNDGNLTITAQAYDSAGRQSSVTDPLGRVTSYTYDALGRMTDTTLPDPDGNGALTSPVLHTAYDNLGRVKQSVDPLGHTTSIAYANFGRQVTTTLPDPDGNGPLASPSSVVVYDALGNITSSTDARSAVTTYAYDDMGRTITVTQPDPDGNGPLTAPVTHYAYDKAGNLRFVTDPLSHVTEYAYDARNRLVETIQPDPDGNGPLTAPTTHYAYDDAGQLTSVTDPLTRVTSYQYDALGRTIGVTQPDPDGAGPLTAPTATYAYDAASRQTSVTDPLGNVTSFGYDALDNRTSVTQADPDGAGPLAAPVMYSVYDAAGQLTQTTDPEGRITSYEYDKLSRQTKVTQPDPDGGGPLARPYTAYTYDAASNLKTVTDPLSHVTTYESDNLNRQTKVTDPVNHQTRFTYDAVNNRLTLTDADNNTTTWYYDLLGRVTAETNPLNKSRNFTYDAVGNLTERLDRLNRKIQYTYDNLYRNTAEYWLGGQNQVFRTLSFAYDAAGQLTSASDPAAAYTYTYDNLGRVTAESQSLSGLSPALAYQSQYNALGLLTQVQAVIGSTNDFKNTYQYDNLSRPTSIRQQGVASGNAVAEKRADLAYSATGQFKQIDRYANVAGSQHVVSSFYGYDGIGRLASLVHSTNTTAPSSGWGSGALAGYQYTYDAANRITALNSFLGGNTSYTLDNTNQLTGADHPTGQTDESYTYDANGNRSMTGNTVGTDNRLTSDGTYNYQYDDEGNRTKRTSIATGAVTNYQWDYRNRLVNVTDIEAPIGHTEGQGTSWGWGGSNAGSSAVVIFDPGNDLGEVSIQGSVYHPNVVWDEDLQEWVDQSYWVGYELKAVQAAEGNSIELYGRLLDSGSESFDFSTQDYQADSNDYTATSGSFSLDSETFVGIGSISTTVDNLLEGNEALNVNFHATSGYSDETLSPVIFDTSRNISFVAFASSAIEGNDVVLTVSADGPANYEYWVEDVSAVRGTHYTVDPNDPNVTGGQVWADTGSNGQVSFATTDDNHQNITRSFAIHVRMVDHSETEVVIEADILDNDTPQVIQTVDYNYDVFDRLVKRTLDDDGQGAHTAKDTFFSTLNGQTALQFDGNAASSLDHRYFYGPAVDQILADETVTSLASAGSVLYPLADQLGSTNDLAEFDSGTTTIANHRVFDSYGNLVSETASSVDSLFGFTGRMFDSATNLQYNWHRWFDPATGQFLSKDPLGLGPDTNPYRYVKDSPTDAVDPIGFSTIQLVESSLAMLELGGFYTYRASMGLNPMFALANQGSAWIDKYIKEHTKGTWLTDSRAFPFYDPVARAIWNNEITKKQIENILQAMDTWAAAAPVGTSRTSGSFFIKSDAATDPASLFTGSYYVEYWADSCKQANGTYKANVKLSIVDDIDARTLKENEDQVKAGDPLAYIEAAADKLGDNVLGAWYTIKLTRKYVISSGGAANRPWLWLW